MMFNKICLWENIHLSDLFSIVELLLLEKIIQVDLYNKSTYRVIFFQCGGLSLRIYLSRPDDIYQKVSLTIYEILFKSG
jgi:hypothetical protein